MTNDDVHVRNDYCALSKYIFTHNRINYACTYISGRREIRSCQDRSLDDQCCELKSRVLENVTFLNHLQSSFDLVLIALVDAHECAGPQVTLYACANATAYINLKSSHDSTGRSLVDSLSIYKLTTPILKSISYTSFPHHFFSDSRRKYGSQARRHKLLHTRASPNLATSPHRTASF